MSIPFRIADDYTTFNSWMADAHSLMAHIQHEIDCVELGGGDSDYIRTEALGELIAMTEAFSKLLELGDKLKMEQDAA